MNTLKIWDNPLVIRGIRTRLRLPLMLSWGLVTIVASTFLYIIVSGNAIKQANATVEEAAREAILPLLILQGVILMVLGTGAVAGGMARERTYRLLDYQRLTPMSPSAKIIGMLIGLPIREYFMFALTLPFVFYAAWVGGLSFGVLVQFYLVFISSAMLYHMTGLTAGMVVDKPWRAGTVSQGLVVVLYLFLPQVAQFGFSFFEFLTARPVFYGLINQHLMPDGISEFVQAQLTNDRYESVAFFGMNLSPTVFSLAVQAFAIVSLYVIVHRKWQSESRLPFSKSYALLFFAVAQFFLVGSILPVLQKDELFFNLAMAYGQRDPVNQPARVIIFIVLLINLVVSACATMLTIYLCTPNWFQSVAGLRRSIRKGKERMSWTDDAASSLPVTAACILMSCLGFIAVYQTASYAGRLNVSNSMLEVLLPLLIIASVLIVVQQLIEQFSERVFVMGLFILWLVPVLVMIVVASVFDQVILGLYIGMLFPLEGLYFATAMLISDFSSSLDSDVVPLVVRDQIQPVVMLTIVLYGGSALMLMLRSVGRWKRIRAAASQAPAPSKREPDTPAIDPSAAAAVAAVVATEDTPSSS